MKHCLAVWKCIKLFPLPSPLFEWVKQLFIEQRTTKQQTHLSLYDKCSYMFKAVWLHASTSCDLSAQKQTRIQYMWSMSMFGVLFLFIVQKYVGLLLFLLWSTLHFQTVSILTKCLMTKVRGFPSISGI